MIPSHDPRTRHGCVAQRAPSARARPSTSARARPAGRSFRSLPVPSCRRSCVPFVPARSRDCPKAPSCCRVPRLRRPGLPGVRSPAPSVGCRVVGWTVAPPELIGARPAHTHSTGQTARRTSAACRPPTAAHRRCGGSRRGARRTRGPHGRVLVLRHCEGRAPPRPSHGLPRSRARGVVVGGSAACRVARGGAPVAGAPGGGHSAPRRGPALLHLGLRPEALAEPARGGGTPPTDLYARSSR